MWRKCCWTRRCEDRRYLPPPRAGHATATMDHAARPAGCRAEAAQPFVQLTPFRNVFLYGSRIHFQEKFRLDGNQSISRFAKRAEPLDAGHNERERLAGASCRCSLRTNRTQADGENPVHRCWASLATFDCVCVKGLKVAALDAAGSVEFWRAWNRAEGSPTRRGEFCRSVRVEYRVLVPATNSWVDSSTRQWRCRWRKVRTAWKSHFP